MQFELGGGIYPPIADDIAEIVFTSEKNRCQPSTVDNGFYYHYI